MGNKELINRLLHSHSVQERQLEQDRYDAAAAIMAAEAARDDAIEQIYHKSQEAMRLHNELLARATCAEARVAALEGALRRAQTILANMTLENENAWLLPRWQISHEPLRSDAKHILPVIAAALTAPAPVDREVCWLVERHDIGERAKYYFELYKGRHGWTSDVHSAHKFASKAAAIAVVGNATDLHVREHVFGLGLPPAPATRS